MREEMKTDIIEIKIKGLLEQIRYTLAPLHDLKNLPDIQINEAWKPYFLLRENIKKQLDDVCLSIASQMESALTSYKSYDITGQIADLAIKASGHQSAFEMAVDTDVENAIEIIEEVTGESEELSKIKENTKGLSLSERISIILMIIQLLFTAFSHIDNRIQAASDGNAESESMQILSDKLVQISNSVQNLAEVLGELFERDQQMAPENQEGDDKAAPANDTEEPSPPQ